MEKKVIPLVSGSTSALAPVILQAEPEPIEIDLQRMAVMVIDMRHAFVSNGGMFDLWGFDISGSQKIIEPIRKITSAARLEGCKIIYTVAAYSPDLRESGALDSSTRFKAGSALSHCEHPEWRDKLVLRGTWGADIVEELKPQEGDILVEKARRSAFFATNLDIVLRTFNIKYLVFVGVATNVCVESSLRDASYLGYWSILVSDACANTGPPFIQEATIFNVRRSFGWVTTTENIMKVIQ